MSQLRQQGLVRFDFLDGALPGRANPTDIDQAIERNGYFLFLECKRPRQAVSTGQRIFFDRLVAGPRRIDVVIVQGNPPDDITAWAPWGSELRATNTKQFRATVRRWYERASQQRVAA